MLAPVLRESTLPDMQSGEKIRKSGQKHTLWELCFVTRALVMWSLKRAQAMKMKSGLKAYSMNPLYSAERLKLKLTMAGMVIFFLRSWYKQSSSQGIPNGMSQLSLTLHFFSQPFHHLVVVPSLETSRLWAKVFLCSVLSYFSSFYTLGSLTHSGFRSFHSSKKSGSFRDFFHWNFPSVHDVLKEH